MAGRVAFAPDVEAMFKLPGNAHLRTSATEAYLRPVRKEPPDDQLPHQGGGRKRRQRMWGKDGVCVTVDHRTGVVIYVQRG